MPFVIAALLTLGVGALVWSRTIRAGAIVRVPAGALFESTVLAAAPTRDAVAGIQVSRLLPQSTAEGMILWFAIPTGFQAGTRTYELRELPVPLGPVRFPLNAVMDVVRYA